MTLWADIQRFHIYNSVQRHTSDALNHHTAVVTDRRSPVSATTLAHTEAALTVGKHERERALKAAGLTLHHVVRKGVQVGCVRGAQLYLGFLVDAQTVKTAVVRKVVALGSGEHLGHRERHMTEGQALVLGQFHIEPASAHALQEAHGTLAEQSVGSGGDVGHEHRGTQREHRAAAHQMRQQGEQLGVLECERQEGAIMDQCRIGHHTEMREQTSDTFLCLSSGNTSDLHHLSAGVLHITLENESRKLLRTRQNDLLDFFLHIVRGSQPLGDDGTRSWSHSRNGLTQLSLQG
mmetsp:Transcript_12523/g.31789  ORF Transcript_12523/g.31789 Transcript_12523/m.31789 type:complete len:292 (-) Transcript_12523:779-1654(-)